MADFNQFIQDNAEQILQYQKDRLHERFDGKMPIETLVANILSETDDVTFDVLKAYHEWLLNNFDIKPKN